MKQVKWEEFRLSPMRYASEKFKVVKGDGGYFLVEYHSPYVEDDAKEVKKERGENKGKDKLHRCGLCGSTWRVVWVVPFDAVVVPGWYCYKCRKSRSILDVKKAKKYNKI
jgi:hypothetical protein